MLGAIAASHQPSCQIWLFVEFKSFSNSPVKNPCPVYLQAQHSGPNAAGGGASTCFMWEPAVVNAYVAMMKAAAVHFDTNPRVEGLILQESALGLNGAYSQDEADGGTYTALAWRDALIEIIISARQRLPTAAVFHSLILCGADNPIYTIFPRPSRRYQTTRSAFQGPMCCPTARTFYKDVTVPMRS